MKIRFRVPRVLQNASGEELVVDFDGDTVGELLTQVQRDHPELYRSICDETGSLRQHVNLFLNNDLFDRNQFSTPLQPDDVVSVFQSVSGG